MPGRNTGSFAIKESAARNLFIITIDGFRWQEVFTGADSLILNNDVFTADKEMVKSLYWNGNAPERRKKLMPFLWSHIAANGQLYGNRLEGNLMNTANMYSLSYPGYNELLTGTTDPLIFNNDKKLNPNINLLEYLQEHDTLRNKPAAFTSWNMFPYILNRNRNRLLVNTSNSKIRSDRLSYTAAKSYLEKNQPGVLLLALGETDEYAHAGKYDNYLRQATTIDSMIADLWNWTQQNSAYKDNTLFVITTDHGRGASAAKWFTHGIFTKGSSQTWMACIGPGIAPFGEMKQKQQLYTKQLPTQMAAMGFEFKKKTKQ